MKKLLPLCLAAMLAFGTQAHAAFIDQSQTIDKAATLAEAGSFSFGREINTAAAALGATGNRFNDRYAFHLDSAAYASAQLTSLLFDDQTGLNITGLDLYKDGVAQAVLVGSLFDPEDQTWLLGGIDTLAAGNYYLQVSGYATDTKASYSGTLSVSPVPEPGSLALMLGGLAVLGFATRRRT